jgi:malonate transporter
MSLLLTVLAPVFIIIGLGWLAAVLRLFGPAAQKGTQEFCFKVGMPALLFLGGTTGGSAGGPAALVFFAVAVPMFILSAATGGLLLRLSAPRAAMFGLNASYGNTAMMGVPIVLAGWGPEGLSHLLGIIALHSVLLLPLATALTEFGLNARAPVRRILRSTLTSLLYNPIVLAVLVALAWHGLHLPVPVVLQKTLTLLGNAAPPAALFCMGATLAGFSPRGAAAQVVLACLGKLLVMPALVFLLGRAVGLAPLPLTVAVITAGLPTGANAFLLAQRYATEEGVSGATVLITALLSVGTLSLAMLALHQAGLP